MDNTPTSPYNAPQSPAAAMGNQAPVLSLGDWIITLIVLAIPLVNLVMLLIVNKTADKLSGNSLW